MENLEWTITIIAIAILVFLMYRSRLLKIIIKMKKVIFECEHLEKDAPNHIRLLTWDNAQREYENREHHRNPVYQSMDFPTPP